MTRLQARPHSFILALLVGVPLILSGTSLAYAVDEAALLSYKQSFAKEMCKEGGAWLRCFQLDPANCNAVVGSVVERCTRVIVEKQHTAPKGQGEVEAVSNKIVECVEKNFRERYDAFKLNTPECKNL
jgi:hypothetical protein